MTVYDIASVVAIIGLCASTVLFVGKAIKLKNWVALVTLVIKDMIGAEKLFEKGTDKKAWVLEKLKEHAEYVGYPLTDESVTRIGELIDTICDATKQINT